MTSLKKISKTATSRKYSQNLLKKKSNNQENGERKMLQMIHGKDKTTSILQGWQVNAVQSQTTQSA